MDCLCCAVWAVSYTYRYAVGVTMKHWDSYIPLALCVFAGYMAGGILWPLYSGTVAWCKKFKAVQQYKFYEAKNEINGRYAYDRVKTRVA